MEPVGQTALNFYILKYLLPAHPLPPFQENGFDQPHNKGPVAAGRRRLPPVPANRELLESSNSKYACSKETLWQLHEKLTHPDI